MVLIEKQVRGHRQEEKEHSGGTMIWLRNLLKIFPENTQACLVDRELLVLAIDLLLLDCRSA